MESALTAAEHVRAGKEYTGDPGTFDFDTQQTQATTHDIDTEQFAIDDEDFTRQVSRELNLPLNEAPADRRVCRTDADATLLDQDRSIASTLGTSTSAFSDTIVWPLAASLPSSRTKKTTSAPLNLTDDTNEHLNSRGNLLSER